MGPPVYISHPSSLLHDTGAHPERPERIVAIEQELARRDWLGYRRVPSPPASDAQLRAVHSASHLEALDALCGRGGGPIDADTCVSPRSGLAARHGAGGAVTLVDLLLGEGVPAGFSAHRPPGHHATRDRAMGFCLFNSVAVAAQHALDSGAASRVAILDWDVHHGNGTSDIFHSSSSVLYASIHQSSLYPGTGARADRGSGAGLGHTLNLPVPPGSGDACFGSLVAHVVVPVLLAFEPQLVLVSAGYDAHALDPLADCSLTEAGYAHMTSLLVGAAHSLRAPIGVVLEGGYDPRALSLSVVATMQALNGPPLSPGEVPRHPAAELAARDWTGPGPGPHAQG